MCGTTWLLLSNTAVQNPAGVFTLFISFGFKTAATTLYQHLFLHIGRELRTHLCFFFKVFTVYLSHPYVILN